MDKKKRKLIEMFTYRAGHPIVYFNFEGVPDNLYGIQHNYFEEFGQYKSILKDGTVYESGKKYIPKSTIDIQNPNT